MLLFLLLLYLFHSLFDFEELLYVYDIASLSFSMVFFVDHLTFQVLIL